MNLFDNTWRKLQDENAINEIGAISGEGDGIFYLNERFYSEEFGVSTEVVNQFDFFEL